MEPPSTSASFNYPFFYSYPPYFTIQPVKETRDRQSSLWGQLILSFCKHHKVFVINTQDDSFVPFTNANINRKLNLDARVAFLDDLVASGQAEWLEAKAKRLCLIYWKKIPDWAASIYNFIKTYGLTDSVMTLDELSNGDDVRGSELQGLHREVLVRALKLLEAQGKVKMFKGATAEEEGVKFL
mmetsp:Transcript_32397/g.71591  ORF Transcript_32397/g.71591 Transcript_32397/m.71591 type:complete len:184 (+) Transcript_32397:43-594(+)